MASPEFDCLRLDHDGPISWITLNRPDRANALSPALLDQLSLALHWLQSNGGAVIGIRGAGRGFSAGYDLGKAGAYGAPDPVDDFERLSANIARFRAIWDHPKPVIAAIHGYCFGGGAQLAGYADIIIAAEDARIAEPMVPIGGGLIAPQWVPQIGARRAKEFAFVPGNWIDGRTARDWGWANHAVPADRLTASVVELAGRMAQVPPEVLRLKKLSINRAAEACGYRTAGSEGAAINALLHAAHGVQALRREIAAEGLRPVAERFAGPSSIEIFSSTAQRPEDQ